MLSQLTTLYSKVERPYTGSELRPHFLLSALGLKGSGLAAFAGGCTVKTDHLVDWEDRLEGAQGEIKAARMVHFIGEFFGLPLSGGVILQRLLMSQMGDLLNEMSVTDRISRRGDDLFALERKLSVSIATASPVSSLIHCGININPEGAPVPAIGLQELGISHEAFALKVLDRFKMEWEGMQWACVKVRPVV